MSNPESSGGSYADAFEAYLFAKAAQAPAIPTFEQAAADEAAAIVATGQPMHALMFGAFEVAAASEIFFRQADLRLPANVEENGRQASRLRAATDFLRRHLPDLRDYIDELRQSSLWAGRLVAEQTISMSLAAIERAQAGGQAELAELPVGIKPDRRYGLLSIIRAAAVIDSGERPPMSFSDFSTLFREVYELEGAPKIPRDPVRVLGNPLIQVGVVETVVERKPGKRTSIGYRLVAPGERENRPLRHRPDTPRRVYLSEREALVLATQLNRLRDELADEELPTIHPALLDRLTAVEEPSRVSDQQVLEARRAAAEKAGFLREAPRLIWLLDRVLPVDDPRRQLLRYIAALPKGKLRLWQGLARATRVRISFTQKGTGTPGQPGVVEQVQVYRDDE